MKSPGLSREETRRRNTLLLSQKPHPRRRRREPDGYRVEGERGTLGTMGDA